LYSICTYPNWVNNLLLRHIDEATVLANDTGQWDEIYTVTAGEKWETGDTEQYAGLPYLTDTYGANLKVIYHDTLPQQLGPSLDDGNGFVQSIEENRDGREGILDITKDAGFVAGSGEGVSAWWTVPHLDYWEGGMEESTYGDINRHPNMDYDQEFADDDYPCGPGDPDYPCDPEGPGSWHDQETACMDETVRIPLLALQWHNYVAETWNWRDSNFVVGSLSWKKDLFNILYGAMPMWHVTSDLWTAHSAEYIASYKKLLAGPAGEWLRGNDGSRVCDRRPSRPKNRVEQR